MKFTFQTVHCNSNCLFQIVKTDSLRIVFCISPVAGPVSVPIIAESQSARHGHSSPTCTPQNVAVIGSPSNVDITIGAEMAVGMVGQVVTACDLPPVSGGCTERQVWLTLCPSCLFDAISV